MVTWPDIDFPPINLWSAPAQVKTECKKMCKLDPTRSYCQGCFRTIEEIIERGKNKPRQNKG